MRVRVKTTYVEPIEQVVSSAFVLFEDFQILKDGLLDVDGVLIADTVLTEEVKFDHVSRDIGIN